MRNHEIICDGCTTRGKLDRDEPTNPARHPDGWRTLRVGVDGEDGWHVLDFCPRCFDTEDSAIGRIRDALDYRIEAKPEPSSGAW